MEDDLKILKVEYLSSRLLDLTKIQNISLGDQIEFAELSNEEDSDGSRTQNIESRISQ